jgi:2-isopropylmalate synthase
MRQRRPLTTVVLAHNERRAVKNLTSAQQPGGMPLHKYRRYEPFSLPDRTWPDKVPGRAPIWASVDLRDGNQALIDPMGIDRKRRLFEHLIALGFKEIEVGFPLSSESDWQFTRYVIEQGLIPDDVTIQVMSPIRDGMIERTVEAVRGAPRVILQIYNPTSAIQRRVVFRKSKAEIKELALRGAQTALRLWGSLPGTEIQLQYATESFSQTEPEFALEVCNAVLELWQPRAADGTRIVLPTTVECYPPHEFADRIEWMSRNLAYRDEIILSLHPHNDRGCGVAATELALLAGAERVEGTLFGNGERAGNVCLVTLAMNLFSQGIDPELDLSDLDGSRRVVEECNQLPVSVRHPWVGDFAYTSFAGSHQDAISKGVQARAESRQELWEVPYLPIDPADVGREYQPLVRINRQSGKGGIAYLLRTEHGLDLPRRLQIEFAALVQRQADRGGEIKSAQIWEWFNQEYLSDAIGPPESGDVLQASTHPLPDGSFAGYTELRRGDVVRWGAGLGKSAEEALERSRHSAAGRFSGEDA